MIDVAVDDDRDAGDRPGTDPRPVIDLLSRIGSEWRLIVLYDLQGAEKRFSELRRSTDARPRTLSRVLADLEEAGFVDRRVEEASPVATYYSLTEKGASLCPVFAAMEAWVADSEEASPST